MQSTTTFVAETETTCCNIILLRIENWFLNDEAVSFVFSLGSLSFAVYTFYYVLLFLGDDTADQSINALKKAFFTVLWTSFTKDGT